MDSKQSQYRNIFKTTSLFGGTQVFSIGINLIRSKLVAVLLGSVGMGISGLLQSGIALVQTLSNLGLPSSAVRTLSAANGADNPSEFSRVYTTFKRWILFTGLLGSIATLILAPWLSQWTFGNKEYTWAFIWLSVTLLLNALASGQNALLQGTRRLKDLAKAGIIGSLLGLATSIPLYYLLGIKGIVPVIIVTALSTLAISYFFARRIKVEPVQQSIKESFYAGLDMAKLGIVLMVSGFLVNVVSYLTNIFIGKYGSLQDIGFYRAGWAITTQYTGLIFTAMATDYYPRLSAIHDNIKKLAEAVNQQIEIAILIITPLIVTFICFTDLIVRILLTKEFLVIIPLIRYSMAGMIFKAVSWAMAFLIIAKGNSKAYLVTETLSNIISLLFSLVGYYWFGLQGLGIAFCATYLAYTLIVYFMISVKHKFKFDRAVISILTINVLILAIALLSTFFLNGYFLVAASVATIIVTCLYSFFQLKKKLFSSRNKNE